MNSYYILKKSGAGKIQVPLFFSPHYGMQLHQPIVSDIITTWRNIWKKRYPQNIPLLKAL